MIAIKKIEAAQSPQGGAPVEAAQLSDWEVQRFKVGGGDICAIIEPGSGPPVVFLHGNSSSKRVWVHQFSCMRNLGRAFLAVDLPGHGESQNSRTPEVMYSFPGYAAVIRDLLNTLGWAGVDVVGWSLGGHVGLELLATDSRVRSLMIIGTPPARPTAGVVERVFYRSEGMEFASKRDLSDWDAFAYGVAMMGGRKFLTPQLLEDIKRTDGRARECMFENVLRGVGTDQQVTVERTTKPLCVVHGEWEPFVRLDYLRSLNYGGLWNDRIYIISEAGHAPQWQCPATFNTVLVEFLSSTHELADLTGDCAVASSGH